MNSDPPMMPMFRWYHLSTDELFASWMFFIGTFWLLPYLLILLAEEGSKLVVMLVLALIGMLLVQLIWVYACYPHDEKVDR